MNSFGSLLGNALRRLGASLIKPGEAYTPASGNHSNDTSGSTLRAISSNNQAEKLTWLGRGQILQTKYFEITDPLTYASNRYDNRGGYAEYPAEIDRSLPTTMASSSPPLTYWPWYSRLTPEQRFIYLQWLASDRKSLPPEDGYLFIYFYGLERRVLAEGTDQGLIFMEAMRLKLMHAALSPKGPRGSFQNYSAAFLWFMIGKYASVIDRRLIKTLVKATHTWTEDTLAAALSWFAEREYPLRPWMAYVVAEQSPLSHRSVVVNRVSDEFQQLFAKRYEAEFGKGMILKSSKRTRTISYRPASDALPMQEMTVSNPLGLPSQFRRLSELWNECVADLKKLSGVVRKFEGTVATAEAWEALPPELRDGLDHPCTDPICDLVLKNTDDDGHVYLGAGDLASIINIDKREKLTVGQSQKIASTVEYAGFAIEPDARLTGRYYAWNETVTMFPLAYEGTADSNRYGGAECILRLGMEIAEADGRIDDIELNKITEHIESGFELNEHERRRLEALRSLLLKTGSNVSWLANRAQSTLKQDIRLAIGRLLVAIAGIDGVITKGETHALNKCFRLLGLPPDSLDTIIREFAPSTDESPVSIVAARPGKVGEAIPRPQQEEAGIRLDRGRIMAIMNETRQVSMMLAKAMNVDTEPATVTISSTISVMQASSPPAFSAESAAPPAMIKTVTTDESVTPWDGIPPRYTAFIHALVAQDRWERPAAELLARQYDQMLSGAIEAINEWACDRVGNPLLYEDGDIITIEHTLLEGLKKK